MNTIVIKAFFATLFLYLFSYLFTDTYTLTIEAYNLMNENGVVQFAVYNRNVSLPDEHYKNHYKLKTAKITSGKSTVTFKKLPPGFYAVNVLHDENENGKIDKGLFKPKEGIGFSNYEHIGLKNRPHFRNAGFELTEDMTIRVKVIYM